MNLVVCTQTRDIHSLNNYQYRQHKQFCHSLTRDVILQKIVENSTQE